MRNYTTFVSLIGVVAVIGLCLAQSPTRPNPASAGKTSQDEPAIREAVAGYMAAFNKGDAAGLADYWAEDAEYIADDGTTASGRGAIADRFKILFADNKGLTLVVTLTAVKVLGPSAAIVDGTARLTDPKMGAETSPFESVWVKTNEGRWLLSRVRDLSPVDDRETNYDQLKELEWLVGEWASDGSPIAVTFSCRWEKNRNFLVHEQTVKVGGQQVLTVTKYIGWDPAEGRMRSWVFDSEGGFGSGMWSRYGNEWTEEVEFRNRGALDGSARNIWKFNDDGQFEWKAVNREVDGQPVADAAVKFVRKASR